MSNNDNKSCASTSINWYPGHMVKAKREIIQNLKLIDVVVEILDARIPISSHNPDLNQIIKNKKKLILLNKSDLAQESENKKWIEFFKKEGIKTISVDSKTGKGVNETISIIKDIMKDELDIQAKKGKVGKQIRTIVLGIPNVGKSSYINRLTKRVSANVGNKPGVTKQKQWIKLDKNIELLDTPGILWPKFDTEEIALNLAFTGTIKDEILENTEIAYKLLEFLISNYYDNVINRYKLENVEIKTDNKILEYMELIGKKRGALVSGGKVDFEKTANILLDDFRSGKLGRITLEKVR